MDGRETRVNTDMETLYPRPFGLLWCNNRMIRSAHRGHLSSVRTLPTCTAPACLLSRTAMQGHTEDHNNPQTLRVHRAFGTASEIEAFKLIEGYKVLNFQTHQKNSQNCFSCS